ncbi:MAG: ribosomal protein L13e [Candidatus Bathyarchaeia archaeon]|jgi:large subunit ribosomal protein L13e
MRQIKVVIIKHNKKQNIGRGFSPTELEKAGVNKQQAKQIGLPVDVKRKSAHDQNIATIKEHAEKAKAQAAAKPKPQKPQKTEPKPKKKAKS